MATWSYDVLDNIRTHATTPVSGPTWSRAYHYDVSNRLTSITQDGGAWGHYTYDPRGNMIDKTGQTLVFDRANRLTQIPNVASYEYDGHGRRTSQWRADGTVRVSLYTLDGRLQGEADNRAVGSTDYMYLGSTLVAKRFQHWSGSPPVVTYQHSDGLGSPVLETDANGAVVSRERFLSYGGAVDGAVNDTIGYTGHQEDPASGLVYMQQRYYDPAIGRFLSIDPVRTESEDGENFNRYWYGNANPVVFVDPDGRKGKVGWLVELGTTTMRRVARVTQEQAVKIRRQGKEFEGDSHRISRRVETIANGRSDRIRHRGHELKDSEGNVVAKGQPHYQTDGVSGHSFFGNAASTVLSVGTVALLKAADMADAAAQAADLADPFSIGDAGNANECEANCNITNDELEKRISAAGGLERYHQEQLERMKD